MIAVLVTLIMALFVAGVFYATHKAEDLFDAEDDYPSWENEE